MMLYLRCAYRNLNNSKPTSLFVTILALPYLVRSPVDVDALEDQDVAIPCFANGVPYPSVMWLTNGKPIEGNFEIWCNTSEIL
jgi:Immunoglobulin I-set domain